MRSCATLQPEKGTHLFPGRQEVRGGEAETGGLGPCRIPEEAAVPDTPLAGWARPTCPEAMPGQREDRPLLCPPAGQREDSRLACLPYMPLPLPITLPARPPTDR